MREACSVFRKHLLNKKKPQNSVFLFHPLLLKPKGFKKNAEGKRKVGQTELFLIRVVKSSSDNQQKHTLVRELSDLLTAIWPP